MFITDCKKHANSYYGDYAKPGGNWKGHVFWLFQSLPGHARIATEITNPIFHMGCDTMTPMFFLDKLFKFALDWEMSRVKQKREIPTQMWYVDGS